MLAYVIVAHQEFEGVIEILKGIYTPDDFFCVTVTRSAIEKALQELNGLRSLPNIHLITAPPTSWGEALEAYMLGIDFCLRFDEKWQTLIALSGTDIPLLPPDKLKQLIGSKYAGKIVLNAHHQKIDFNVVQRAQRRLLDDPFRQGDAQQDVMTYNPFPFPLPIQEREGIKYILAPDTARVAWAENNYFSTFLSRQVNSYGSYEVYTEKQSKFAIKLLDVHLKGKNVACSSFWGVFPRDFLHYATNDVDALTLYSIIGRSFSIEESYFATLATNYPFSERLLHEDIMFKLPAVDARLPEDILTPELTGNHLLARKSPDGMAKIAFIQSVYDRYGIISNSEIMTAATVDRSVTSTHLIDIFRSVTDINSIKFDFGPVNGPNANTVIMEKDGTISHFRQINWHDPGNYWRWTEDNIGTWIGPNHEEAPYAQFSAFRCRNGRALMLGNWLHHYGVPIVLEGALDGHMCLSPGEGVLTTLTGEAINVATGKWEFWFSGEEVNTVAFLPDGRIIDPVTEIDPLLIGYWGLWGGKLITLGLHDMLVAEFQLASRGASHDCISGVSLGRVAKVEPCVLRRRR